MIVSIRGTNGSGKSYLAAQLMKVRRHEGILEDGHLVGYLFHGFRVVGPYSNGKSGGVDVLKRGTRRRDMVFELIDRWAGLGHVFYEGLLVSNEVPRTIALAKKYPSLIIFLSTPLEDCLASVQQRRAARISSLFDDVDVLTKVDPKRVKAKHEELGRVAKRLEVAGVPVEWHTRETALTRTLQTLGLS